jgi:hypothetical protein
MLRTIIVAGFIAANLAGVASAAEPGQPLVNRNDGEASVSASRNNLVGGTVNNPDGSVGHTYQNSYQNGHHWIDNGYNQTPAGAYQGN